MRWLRIAAFVVGAALAPPSFAGIDKGNGEIGFDFGVVSFDEDLFGHSAAYLKVRGGYHVTRLFQVEAQYGYAAHYDEEILREDRRLERDQDLRTFFLNGVFNFHSAGGNIVPFVLAGYGASKMEFPFESVDDSSAAWQVAGGSRFFFGDHDQAAFRLEAAFLFDDLFDQSNRQESLTAGFTWRLGTP